MIFDIAFMGTSLTSRIVETKWIDTFRSTLRKQSGKLIRTYDFGYPGQTSDFGCSIAKRVSDLKPRAAVIEYAMNDAVPSLNIPISTFSANITNIITMFRTNSPKTSIFLMTMNPVIPPGTTVVPNLLDYYQALRTVAVAQAVGLIDNTPSWGTPSASQMMPDGIHPLSDAAATVIVPNVLAAVAPLVA